MFDLFVIGGIWLDTLSVMLIGMGLLKTGFLTGQLANRTYFIFGAIGVGVLIMLYTLRYFLSGDTTWETSIMDVVRHIRYFAGSFLWITIIVLAVKNGWRARALAAVGKTAFTIYILQSVIGLLLFSSLGLGLFGHLSRDTLMVITVSVFYSFWSLLRYGWSTFSSGL